MTLSSNGRVSAKVQGRILTGIRPQVIGRGKRIFTLEAASKVVAAGHATLLHRASASTVA